MEALLNVSMTRLRMEKPLTHLLLQPLPMRIGSLVVEVKSLVLGFQNLEVIGHEGTQESLSM
jgi:hypothetical protein